MKVLVLCFLLPIANMILLDVKPAATKKGDQTVIEVKTGSAPGDSSNGRFPTQFFSSEGTSCTMRDLDNPNKNDFESGQVDYFTGSMLGPCETYHPEKISSVKITHASGSGWRGEYLRISYGEKIFTCKLGKMIDNRESITFPCKETSKDKCCMQKEVGGKIYTFLDNISEDEKERFKCSNTCAYSYKNGEKNQKFCFKPGYRESKCLKDGVDRTTIKIRNKTPYVGKMAGKINFEKNVTLDFTLPTSSSVTYDVYGPLSKITSITAFVQDSPVSCFSYKPKEGETPVYKFIIEVFTWDTCIVVPDV